jgi:hypothetical protein
MQPQFSAPPVKWAPPPAPEASEVPLRIDDNGDPVFPEWGDRDSPVSKPDQPLVSKRAGEVIMEDQVAADAALMRAYGKISDELADEAEAGYDVEKMRPRVDPTEEALGAEPTAAKMTVDVPPDKPKRKPRKRAAAKKTASAELANVDDVSDEQLMADYGVEQVFSTTDTAEFFDRTNQWLYWGLREGVFTHEDGKLVDPDRIGDPERGRRRFTLPIIKDILVSSYRRGNIEPDELKHILRRIRIAELGGEWREKEGWHQVELGKRKVRWVKPENCVFDESVQKWVLREGVKLESD